MLCCHIVRQINQNKLRQGLGAEFVLQKTYFKKIYEFTRKMINAIKNAYFFQIKKRTEYFKKVSGYLSKH